MLRRAKAIVSPRVTAERLARTHRMMADVFEHTAAIADTLGERLGRTRL